MLCETLQQTPIERTPTPWPLAGLPEEKHLQRKPNPRVRMAFSEADRRRFESYLVYLEDGCWICTIKGSKTGGYGNIYMDGRMRLAHKVAYAMAHDGYWPELPECVLHRCDVRRCCNPDHLFLGTKGTNSTDRKVKGRNADTRGEGNPAAILTASQALEIRARVAAGEVQLHLAREFGVTATCINDLIKRRSWPHI